MKKMTISKLDKLVEKQRMKMLRKIDNTVGFDRDKYLIRLNLKSYVLLREFIVEKHYIGVNSKVFNVTVMSISGVKIKDVGDLGRDILIESTCKNKSLT